MKASKWRKRIFMKSYGDLSEGDNESGLDALELSFKLCGHYSIFDIFNGVESIFCLQVKTRFILTYSYKIVVEEFYIYQILKHSYSYSCLLFITCIA